MTYKITRPAVTHDQIDRVMASFYARVRRHPDLGPVFNAHIGTTDTLWEAHVAKIAAFWRGALLGEPGYDGFPMPVHVQSDDITPALFAPWLALLDQVLGEELDEDTAARWSALAHRIGRGFRMAMGDRVAGEPVLR